MTALRNRERPPGQALVAVVWSGVLAQLVRLRDQRALDAEWFDRVVHGIRTVAVEGPGDVAA